MTDDTERRLNDLAARIDAIEGRFDLYLEAWAEIMSRVTSLLDHAEAARGIKTPQNPQLN